MATTTNYGWTTPDDTALVKDGASAIRSLGSAIDTSLNTALGTKKAGLVLLNTTSFSAVASQAITQFSAAYENYTVLIRITAHNTTAGSHFIRMRSGSTDDTGNNFYIGGALNRVNTSTISGSNQNGASSFTIGDGVTTNTNNFYIVDFISPFLAQKTGISSRGLGEDTTTMYSIAKNGGHNLANSYDGFNLIAGAGTITGKLAIYGYNF